MGADERVWVHWGAGDTGGHKNKVSRDKNACTGHDLGPMAGEISPDIMFFKKSKKTCTDGSGWVYMGSHGCGGVRAYGGKQKRGETRHKWTRRTLLGMHDHGEKCRKHYTHGNVGFKRSPSCPGFWLCSKGSGRAQLWSFQKARRHPGRAEFVRGPRECCTVSSMTRVVMSTPATWWALR